MREEHFDELVVDLGLNEDFKLLRRANRGGLGDFVLEDVCDVASPSEDHPLAINQLKLVGIIGSQIISALIHTGDCYVQDIAHFKVT